MTSDERRYFMRLLRMAKQGDEVACEVLTGKLASTYSYMLYGFYSVDPAYDKDDLMVQFQYGIWHNIQRVDDRGDPLFHLAWRGQMAVKSLLQVIKRRRHGTGDTRVVSISDNYDSVDHSSETDPECALEAHESQEEARQKITNIMAGAHLSDRQKNVVHWMMADVDPVGQGANVRLAADLGVSQQMASQYRKTVIGMLSGQDTDRPFSHHCPDCGRGFRTQGALTQHARGQSGHKPCVAVSN